MGYNAIPDGIICRSHLPNKYFDEAYGNLTIITNKYSLAKDVTVVTLSHTHTGCQFIPSQYQCI